MELLDRYLKAVGRCLPGTQRDDIIKELSENIRSQVEDQEAELGRPLNEPEVEALLKQHGHPMFVAARYRQDQRSLSFGRQLIGPVLFPFYAKVLSFNVGVTCVVLIVIFTALFANGQAVTFSGIVSVVLYQTLIQFGIVTLIFTVMDKHLTRFPDRWDARNPNQLSFPKFPVAQDAPRVPRMESISQLIALTVSIVWLRAIQHSPFLILGPAAAFLKLAPVWHRFYLPFVLLALAGIAQAGINFVRPDWIRLRSVARVVIGVATLVICCFLLKAGNWIVPGDAAGNLASGYHGAVGIINQCFFYGLIAAVIISAVQLLRDLRRLARGSHNRVPSRI